MRPAYQGPLRRIAAFASNATGFRFTTGRPVAAVSACVLACAGTDRAALRLKRTGGKAVPAVRDVRPPCRWIRIVPLALCCHAGTAADDAPEPVSIAAFGIALPGLAGIGSLRCRA
jgi:hypothetical protein